MNINFTPAQTSATALGLSTAERQKFEADGFIVCPAAADPEAIRDILKDLDAVLATDGYAGTPMAHRHLDTRAVYDLIARPHVTDRVASLLGPNLLLWHSRFFDKPAGAEPVPWHQDMAFWPLEPDLCLSVWIAIDRVDAGNGCVEMIPGSHRRPVPHIPSSGTGRFGRRADPYYVDEDRKVRIELEPGEFVIFDRWILHSSPRNHSHRRRLGLSARIVPTQVLIKFDLMNPTFPELGAQLIRGEDHFRLNRKAPAPSHDEVTAKPT